MNLGVSLDRAAADKSGGRQAYWFKLLTYQKNPRMLLSLICQFLPGSSATFS